MDNTGPGLPANFAPAARSSPEVLNAQRRKTENSDLFNNIVHTIPDLLLVLNQNRQIIYANRPALDFLGMAGIEDLLGMRPGEAVNCVNAFCPGGCGTSEKCSACGAVLSILASQLGETVTNECRILSRSGGEINALDLKVTAGPIEVEGEKFTVFYVADISHEKRRRALERIFFHDVLNTAGVLGGFSGVMSEEKDPQALRSLAGTISRISQRLTEEIVAQRELLKAESGELRTAPKTVRARELLEHICESYKNHEDAKGKEIKVLPGPEVTLVTDETLLSRVLGNMLKNALEASAAGEAVSVGVAAEGARAVFRVHNRGAMAKEVELQVFTRSFSTKGADRGLGTYSIKLISERYLKGEVGFTSSVAAGTSFILKLPPAL